MADVQSAASRYDSIVRLAAGGMATVWVGTVRGALGFRQLVALKKPHPHLLEDPQFRAELLAEARLASMIHHANVVDVRDVEIDGGAITLVMDYIEGASLGELIVAASKQGKKVPPGVAVRVILDACAGLHGAHELVDERGRPVSLVHRDVSPQNILIGLDGIARVTDFGVAKFARKNMQSTSNGSLKGKLAYMAPEYLRGEAIDRRFDVFGAGVVLWETLAGKRLFRGENEADTLSRVLNTPAPPISSASPELGTALDDVLAHALEKERDERFQNAAAMGAALEATARDARLVASHTEVAATLKELVGGAIEQRRALIRSKLAHEPSVASLMGGVEPAPLGGGALPPTVGPAGAELPPTMSAPAPTTEPGGSELVLERGAAQAPGPAASTLRDAPPAAIALATVSMTATGRPASTEPGPHAANQTALPSTQPMTDRPSPAFAHTPNTLQSAPPAGAQVGTQLSPGIEAPYARTQLSDGPPAWPSAPPPQDSSPEAAFHDPSRAYAAVELSNRASSPAPPRRWGVPIAVGLTVVTLGVAAVLVHVRSQASTSASAHVEPLLPTPTVTASASAVAETSSSPSASAAPSAATKASAKARPQRRVPPTPPQPVAPPPKAPPQAPTAAPAPSPTETGPKRPPPDPYKQPKGP